MTESAKPMLAYAVMETCEYTGGIVYATSAAAARRIGANEFAGGDFGGVSCRRAPWADVYIGQPIPIWLMVFYGWRFECGHCGCRIDNDMLWEKQLENEDLIGFEHTVAYCDARCEAGDALDKAKREHLQKRWLRRFAKIVKRRFPEASPVLHHAYANLSGGRCTIEQVIVEFDFPGRQYGMASLSWRRASSWAKRPSKPQWSCSNGDREAFEAYAAATRSQPLEQVA